jgi:hypothetical protein
MAMNAVPHPINAMLLMIVPVRTMTAPMTSQEIPTILFDLASSLIAFMYNSRWQANQS